MQQSGLDRKLDLQCIVHLLCIMYFNNLYSTLTFHNPLGIIIPFNIVVYDMNIP